MITLLKVILNQMSSIRKPQQKFIEELFSAMLAARGKLTFRNLSRYSNLCEKTCFDTISEEEVQNVENLLNSRPRKVLKFRTPLEAFNQARFDLSLVALRS